MNYHYQFQARGRPVPKGSARWVVSRTTGKPVPIRADNERLDAWSSKLALMGELDRDRLEVEAPGLGPFAVAASFCFERPKKHYKTRQGRPCGLRDDAPDVPAGRNYGDLDKLLRSLLDALTGTIWLDDDSVYRIVAERRFADGAGAVIRVHDMALERLYGASSLFGGGPSVTEKALAAVKVIRGYARALDDERLAQAAADIEAALAEVFEEIAS